MGLFLIWTKLGISIVLRKNTFMIHKPRSLIVAYGKDTYAIGTGTEMPNWDLRDDRIFFKNTTMGDDVIMGRKNYESLPNGYRPLPGRRNIIITKDPSWRPKEQSDNIIIVGSLWEALLEAEKGSGKKIHIIGGGEIYRLAIQSIVFDEVHLTCVNGWFDEPVTFPKLTFLTLDNYECTFKKDFEKVEGRNSHPFSIHSYARKVA